MRMTCFKNYISHFSCKNIVKVSVCVCGHVVSNTKSLNKFLLYTVKCFLTAFGISYISQIWE